MTIDVFVDVVDLDNKDLTDTLSVRIDEHNFNAMDRHLDAMFSNIKMKILQHVYDKYP